MRTIASTRTVVRAPVSAGPGECAAVTSVKTSRATALPIEAIAFRSKSDREYEAGAASTRSPTETRRRSRRPITGGNWPVAASRSQSPAAG